MLPYTIYFSNETLSEDQGQTDIYIQVYKTMIAATSAIFYEAAQKLVALKEKRLVVVTTEGHDN